MAASTTGIAQIGCGIETENKRAEEERFYCIVDGKPYMSCIKYIRNIIRMINEAVYTFACRYNQPGIKNVASNKRLNVVDFQRPSVEFHGDANQKMHAPHTGTSFGGFCSCPNN